MSTPQQRFRVSGAREAFEKMASTAAFEIACDYAFMQLVSELPATVDPNTPTDPYVAIDANAQRYGAGRVLEILKHLHEQEKEPTPTKREQLRYAQPSTIPGASRPSNRPDTRTETGK